MSLSIFMLGIIRQRSGPTHLKALTRYTSDLRDVKGIGFCVGIQHAEFMARFFTKAGIPSLALSGDTPDEVRRKAAADLASGRLTFLFVVDIFNEASISPPSIRYFSCVPRTVSPFFYSSWDAACAFLKARTALRSLILSLRQTENTTLLPVFLPHGDKEPLHSP